MDDYCKGIVEPSGDNSSPHEGRRTMENERSFMFYECGFNSLPPEAHITETELRRRLDAIINLRVRNGGADWSWDKAFDILLNGEKNQPIAVPKNDSDATKMYK